MTRTQHPPQSNDLLIFDGDCGFCRYWLVKWKKFCEAQYDFKPYQEVAEKFPDIDIREFRSAFHLIFKDGRVMKGAEAAYFTYYHAGKRKWPYQLYRSSKWFASFSDAIYKVVANNRGRVYQLTKFFFGPDPYQNATPRFITILILMLAAISLVFFDITSI